jgi:CheY-like chemotaxis protein
MSPSRAASPPSTTVMIVDGNRRLGHVMGQLLDDDPRFTLTAVVSTAEAAAQAAKDRQPDVVLVSQHLRPVCAQLRAAAPECTLLLWTHDGEAAPEPEVDGVLERGMTYRELAGALRDARRRPREPRQVIDLTDRVRSS